MTKKKKALSKPLEPADMMEDFRNGNASIWILSGLVGAGKTTFAQQLWASDPKGTVRSSLDEIIQMMSFYRYEPKMSGFYGGVERSAIIEGLLDGYKVIIDRTNITRKIRGHFISLVREIREIAKDFLGLLSGLGELDFFEQCEKNLIEQILFTENRRNISLYTSFLKLVRDWKAKRAQPSLFAHEPLLIKKHLSSVMNMEIAGIFFDVPLRVCMQRRMDDPRNALRDTTQKVDWRAVIRRMAKQLEPPHMDEGFDRLYRIDAKGKAYRQM